MTVRLMLIAAASLPDEARTVYRAAAMQMAAATGEEVALVEADDLQLTELRVCLAAMDDAPDEVLVSLHSPLSAAPMSAAPFIWRDDGKPDWSAMWGEFCELALFGGPPHRGEDNPVMAPTDAAPADISDETIAEIRRGIWETTGLNAEPGDPGWIAVRCRSRKMAAWLCATIILENVDAHCEGELLSLPASPRFDLKNEVKSVITVLAKTNHYWEAHLQEQTAAAPLV